MPAGKSWTKVWLAWLAFLVGADVVANKKDGATFSEHCNRWFSSLGGRSVLATFLVVLYLHFVYSISVIPVIIAGAGIVFFIVKNLKRGK